MGKKHKRKKLYMVTDEDGVALAIGTVEQIAERYADVVDVHGTYGETLQEQDERAARLRGYGMGVEDIADAMGVSEYRAQQMLTRFDSGRWDE